VVKGRPPVIPRLEALERKVEELESALLDLASAVGNQNKGPGANYVPQFQRWTINGK
jgi:hypothetical protein